MTPEQFEHKIDDLRIAFCAEIDKDDDMAHGDKFNFKTILNVGSELITTLHRCLFNLARANEPRAPGTADTGEAALGRSFIGQNK